MSIRRSKHGPTICGIRLLRNHFILYPFAAMTDNTAPATKADITGLMEHLDRSIQELYDANSRWKEEIIRHFDVAVEDIRHDLLGARRDEVELLKDGHSDHELRLKRVERHVGLN